jgi:hypothetical protein
MQRADTRHQNRKVTMQPTIVSTRQNLQAWGREWLPNADQETLAIVLYNFARFGMSKRIIEHLKFTLNVALPAEFIAFHRGAIVGEVIISSMDNASMSGGYSDWGWVINKRIHEAFCFWFTECGGPRCVVSWIFAFEGKFPWKLAADRIEESFRQQIGPENTMCLLAGPWMNPRPDFFPKTRLKKLLQSIYSPEHDESEDCGSFERFWKEYYEAPEATSDRR